MRDFADIWRAADKIVYSTTLEGTTTARTRLERRFDPEAVRRLKAEAGRDLGIGGGKPALPDGVRLPLELAEKRRFANGTVYLRYRLI